MPIQDDPDARISKDFEAVIVTMLHEAKGKYSKINVRIEVLNRETENMRQNGAGSRCNGSDAIWDIHITYQSA